jgi:ribulose-phosphate 3-epimerase
MVTFHIESAENPQQIINSVKQLGKKVGIALKPNTPIEPYSELIEKIDQLLVMTVEPGFGGQKFMVEMLHKITKARELIDSLNPNCYLQVDGGINLETIELARQAGADTFVAGSAVFDGVDPAAAIEGLRNRLAG